MNIVRTWLIKVLWLTDVCAWCRFRVVRQSCERSGRHSSDERLPDRYETVEGAVETAQGCQQAVLTHTHGAHVATEATAAANTITAAPAVPAVSRRRAPPTYRGRSLILLAGHSSQFRTKLLSSFLHTYTHTYILNTHTQTYKRTTVPETYCQRKLLHSITLLYIYY